MSARLFRRSVLVLALLLATAAWPLPVPAARAATLCVKQGGTGGCFGTISAAITAASDGDTIHIAGALSPYLDHLTIDKSLSLIGDSAATTIIDGSANGQVIRITTVVTVTLTNLTIRNGQSGAGDKSDEEGAGIHNVLGNLTLNHVIVSGNHTGDGICCGGFGGGISNGGGHLTLNDSVVSGNSTGTAVARISPGAHGGLGGFGGGIYMESGTLLVNNGTISGNAAGPGGYGAGQGGPGGGGGGIHSDLGVVTILNSTIRDNLSGTGGGGMHGGDGGNGGGVESQVEDLTLTASTISGNQTGTGGAGTVTRGSSGLGGGLALSIGQPSLVTVTNATISNNQTGLGVLLGSSGGDGGGLYAGGGYTVTLTNATVAYNSVDLGQKGGGLVNVAGAVILKNSLIAFNHTAFGPTAQQDCEGTLTSLGYNLITKPLCTIAKATGDQFGVGGQILNSLADNGGPTQTNALPPGSPAIDAADNSACPATDQRGFPRPAFGGIALRCDIGAFERYRFSVSLPLVVR